jgi:hypothetical protein
MEVEKAMKLSVPNRALPWKLLYGILVAFLCGVIAARLFGLALDARLAGQRLDQAQRPSPASSRFEPGTATDRDLESLSRGNLFSLEGGSRPAGNGSAEVRLLGTFPPLGALFSLNGTFRAVLVGQELGGETLRKVEGTRAFLASGSRTRTLDVLYAGVGGAPPAFAPAPAFPSSRERKPGFDPKSGISPPSGGQDGTIERDVINKLLMDPYQELNRVRLRPKMGEDGSSQGIEAQWLHRDSLLAAMGVRSGDVIHSLNDIPIRTTADIVNAMNSLLNSDRFVVSFFRDGADSQVAYSVK